MRILFVLLLLPGGLSPLLYVVLWIIMPERPAMPAAPSSAAEPYRYDPYTGEPRNR